MAVTLNSASFLKPEDLTPRLAWARNIVFINLQADVNWHLNNSYYLELEIGVFDINTTTYTKLGESLIEEPNSEGTVIFEIQQKMQDYAGINIPAPDFNATQIVQHTTPKFYIKIFEVVDNVKTQLGLDGMSGNVENLLYLVDAIDAGLDRESFSYEQQYDWIFGDIQNGDRRFLTSVEDPKSTTKNANEFLYWFGSQPNRDLTVDCVIHYDDDTEETFRLFLYLPGYHIQCIPVRYDIIKAKSTQPAKNIVEWSVYAAYNGFLVSQYFRYEICDQPNREAKNFLAKNSFGVFDTLVCQGDYEEFLEVENETASKRDFSNYALTDGQKLIVSKTGKRGGTANTAFLNKLQSVVKQDFTLSREMLVQAETGFIPIIAEKIKQIYSVKNNNLIGLSFEYFHAHNVKAYTNKIFRPILGEVPTPPTLPKFTIKNTGSNGGYVRVEYESFVVDVAPNSEQVFEISPLMSIKVTWLVINPDTLLLDENLINVSEPYRFEFGVIENATFDSVIQSGIVVPGLPDFDTASQATSIKKARSFTFVMPNSDYIAECKFRDIKIYFDYDTQSTESISATDSTFISAIADRTGTFRDAVQTTPSLRPKFISNSLEFTAGQFLDTIEAAPVLPAKGGTSFFDSFLVLKFNSISGTAKENFFKDYDQSVAGFFAIEEQGGSFNGSLTYGGGNINALADFRTQSYKFDKMLISYQTSQDAANPATSTKRVFAYINNAKNQITGVDYFQQDEGFAFISSANINYSFYRNIMFYDTLFTEQYEIIKDKLLAHYSI